MIRALSTAATGMNAQQVKLDVTAHNIANASNAGFKKSRVEFEDLIYQNVHRPGSPTDQMHQRPAGLQVGLGTKVVATHTLHAQGDLAQTGNPLDVAIEGRGYFVVQLPNGDQAYTRTGSFKLDQEGRIVGNQGYALATQINVPPEATHISIGVDGTVSAAVEGSAEEVQVGQIELATFTNPDGLLSLGHNLFGETAASGQPFFGMPGENGVGILSQGMLELSNVKVVEEMVDLISGQRAYEVNTRVIRAADEMLQQTVNMR